MVRYAFTARDFHSLLFAGFAGALIMSLSDLFNFDRYYFAHVAPATLVAWHDDMEVVKRLAITLIGDQRGFTAEFRRDLALARSPFLSAESGPFAPGPAALATASSLCCFDTRPKYPAAVGCQYSAMSSLSAVASA